MMEVNRSNTKALIVIGGMILFAALSRLVPHWPNFTPIAAMALFGGAVVNDKRLAYLMPLTALVISDLALSFMFGYDFFSIGRIVIYSTFALITYMGVKMHSKVGVRPVVLKGFLASLIFFVVTNFFVWVSSGMYAHDAAGLMLCYEAAIPYFGNSLLGNAFYLAVLFGGYSAFRNLIPASIKA
ncbi:MAG: hypothetical protein KDD36_10255 [Flavobacteriales bacterium]|nr:hypothetical protein [Flavobacteriales bacterium]